MVRVPEIDDALVRRRCDGDRRIPIYDHGELWAIENVVEH
jgi:hypothetical protein